MATKSFNRAAIENLLLFPTAVALVVMLISLAYAFLVWDIAIFDWLFQAYTFWRFGLVIALGFSLFAHFGSHRYEWDPTATKPTKKPKS